MIGRPFIRGIAGRARIGAALSGAALLAACAAPGFDQLESVSETLPPRVQLDDVPFFPQKKYHCGPAALAMVLAWSGLSVNASDLVPQVYTPGRQGTLQTDVLGAARRNGRLPVPVTRLTDIFREVAGGHPVLVFQNLGLDLLPQWHYAVVTGFDLEAGEMILHSGRDANLVSSIGTFARTWARGGSWALVVLPPEKLPVTATEMAVLRAAAGLERTGKAAAAATAYDAVLRRWPNSFAASMGAGNALFALQKYEAAAASFARAVQARPMSAAAWNNLAHALARQDKTREAIAAARQAVQYGDESPTYRATLNELSRESH